MQIPLIWNNKGNLLHSILFPFAAFFVTLFSELNSDHAPPPQSETCFLATPTPGPSWMGDAWASHEWLQSRHMTNSPSFGVSNRNTYVKNKEKNVGAKKCEACTLCLISASLALRLFVWGRQLSGGQSAAAAAAAEEEGGLACQQRLVGRAF